MVQTNNINIDKDTLRKRKAELLVSAPKIQKRAYKIVDRIAHDIFGFNVRPEHILSPYIIDVWIRDIRVGIELDGGVHEDTMSYDERRDEFLWRGYGAKVYRFLNEDVETKDFKQSIWDICVAGLDSRILKIAYEAKKEGFVLKSRNFMPIPDLAPSHEGC